MSWWPRDLSGTHLHLVERGTLPLELRRPPTTVLASGSQTTIGMHARSCQCSGWRHVEFVGSRGNAIAIFAERARQEPSTCRAECAFLRKRW
mmetsp:Transcript_145365/g.278977  ORF Transcript_145365/g.278977 Transcript_145365/m.278977 type:complete len:92 (+) Transcript_145365:2282-2557(+)